MDFPRQNIPESQKTKDWHLKCVDAILNYNKDYTAFIDSRKKDHENFLIAQGEFDHKQFEYVTDMYGLTSPARLVNYPIIAPKLELLAGELISQPLQYTVNVINRNGIRKKNEEKVQMAAEVLLRPIRREIEQAIGMPIPDENVGQEVPADVERYQKLKFRSAIEEMVHIGLTYCIQKQNMKQDFKRGFYDLSITGKEFYKVTLKNGDPYVERMDPRSMIYDLDVDKETLKDCKYVGSENWYTVNEVLDKYKLKKEEVEELEKLQGKGPGAVEGGISLYDSYSFNGSRNFKVRVVDMQWKSIRMIKYKVSENPFDSENPHYKLVKDTYKPKKGEKIVERAITEIRKATKIGHKIIVDYGAKPNQIRYEENFSETEFDYYGVIKSPLNGNTLSVVDALKNIQMLYNITMFHIELSMARSGGKSVVYDVSQKPKNIPLEDVFHHAKNSGLILINNKAEGMQTNGFNQFQQVDFTLSQSVAQMINLKMMLEETADKLTGISAARSGIQKSGDLVGVTERNVMQSTLITAPLFDLHYQLVGDVLKGVAGLMKIAWGKEGRMANIFGDTGMQTFKIDKSISLDEYGLFIENSGKEAKRKQDMMMLLDRFSSSGNIDPLAVIKSVNAETSSEVETILEQGLEAVKAVANQIEERKVAAQEQSNEINYKKIQVDLDVAKIKSQTDIKVKEMDITGKTSIQDRDLEHKEDMQNEAKNQKLDEIMLQNSSAQKVQSSGG